MSRRRPPTELLPLLAEAFPQTFFTDPKLVQPLKIDIHQDLLAALPAGIKGYEAKSFLWWYVGRPGYNRALLHGRGRVDLTGTVVDTEIPDSIIERARERFLEIEATKRKAKSGKPAGKRPAATPGQPRPATPATPLDLEDLYAMAIDAKLEITLKFSALPNARPAGQGKMMVALKTPDGQFVAVAIANKAWNKLVQANTDWPSWVAALIGTMGERTEKGFTLAGPGLQVFERKSKDTAAVQAPIDTPPAAPAEPVAPPVPAAPIVTVVIKAGTASVAKRAPLTLKR